MSSQLFSVALLWYYCTWLKKNDCTRVGSVHGFVMELKNLKFLQTSCVTLNIHKMKETHRSGDQALPWFSYSLMDCVCMYRLIQGNGMCCATHACVWRLQLDLLNKVCTFGLWCEVRHLWDRSSTPWELTLVYLICVGCLWTLTCSCCMTDWPDVESFLHDWEMALLWISARHDTALNSPFCPLLFPSFHWLAFFLLLIHFAFILFGCLFSWRHLIHSCMSSPFITVVDNNVPVVTGSHKTKMHISLVLIWKHYLKAIHSHRNMPPLCLSCCHIV